MVVRHFLKFLFVTRVHQTCSKFPAFFGEPVVFQYSLHDAIPKASKRQTNIEPSAGNRRKVEACDSTVFDQRLSVPAAVQLMPPTDAI
jgi:hypothetical protein